MPCWVTAVSRGQTATSLSTICKHCLQISLSKEIWTRSDYGDTKAEEWVGRGPVISVRVEPELVERLDALAERAQRSRGDFLRMTLWAVLPRLEAQHWEQLTAEFEIATIRDAFKEITEQLVDDALQTRPSLHNKETSGQPLDGW